MRVEWRTGRKQATSAGAIERGPHFARRLAEMARRLLHGVRLVENVLAGELAVRIAFHVGALADAVAVAEPIGGRLAQQGVNLCKAPDVECAFALEAGVLGRDRAIGIFGRVEAAAGILDYVLRDMTDAGGGFY